MFQKSGSRRKRCFTSRNSSIGICAWLVLTPILLGASGCHFFGHRTVDPFGPDAECHIDPAMSKQRLIEHLNANAALLQGWRSSSVTISGGGMPVEIKGATIAVQAPRNFRLLASTPFTGKPAADLGSNNQEFWFWFADDKQPDVIMCRHEDIAYAGRAMPIPFEPDWLMEVMGVKPIQDYQDSPMVERQGGRYVEIYSNRIAPNGRQVSKRTTVDRCHGIVVEHALLDESGQLIARAKLSQHLADQTSGAILPTHIELSWPQTNMNLTLKLERFQVNPTTSPAQFQIPSSMRIRQIGPAQAVQHVETDPIYDDGQPAAGEFQQPVGRQSLGVR